METMPMKTVAQRAAFISCFSEALPFLMTFA